jgi:hypothetical protein
MRAKVSVWARGFAALAAVGVGAVLILGAGAASASASHGVSAVHVTALAAPHAALSPDETIWG